jgi:hypothetical protein
MLFATFFSSAYGILSDYSVLKSIYYSAAASLRFLYPHLEVYTELHSHQYGAEFRNILTLTSRADKKKCEPEGLG